MTRQDRITTKPISRDDIIDLGNRSSRSPIRAPPLIGFTPVTLADISRRMRTLPDQFDPEGGPSGAGDGDEE